MAYQATYILPLSLGFACVESVRDCILVPARRARSRCPAMHPASSLPTYRRRHTGLAGACLRPTTWARQHRASITSVCGHCLFGPWLNLFSAAPWEHRIHLICERAPRLLSWAWRLEFASFISPRLASTGVTAESCCFFLDDSTVARCWFAAVMSSTHVVISLVADRTLNSRSGRLTILTSLSIWALGSYL